MERQGLNLRQCTPEDWRTDDHSIVFSSRAGRGQTNLWRVPISRSNWQVQGRAEPLTSVTGSAVQASVAATGRTVFANLVENSDLWSLPIAADEGKVLGELEQITHNALWEDFPSISTDGRKLVFGVDQYRQNSKAFAGSRDIHILDLVSGQRAHLADTALSEVAPRISADGSTVVYLVVENGERALHVISTDGGLSRTLTEDGSVERVEPTGWSADGRSILYCHWKKREGRLLNLASGRSLTLLKHPEMSSIYPIQIHSDGWIVFIGTHLDSPLRARIFIAPLRGDRQIPETEWIVLSDGSACDTMSHLSPNGNLLYFLSDRDGYRCIWMQD